MGEETEPKQDVVCKDCWHDIDNHSYKGCLVKRCKCKTRPSEIARTFEALGGKG